MFCNGSQMDECDLARPGTEIITGMTSPEVLFVLAHDCGRHRRLIWAHQSSLSTSSSMKNARVMESVLQAIKKKRLHVILKNCKWFKKNLSTLSLAKKWGTSYRRKECYTSFNKKSH